MLDGIANDGMAIDGIAIDGTVTGGTVGVDVPPHAATARAATIKRPDRTGNVRMN